MYKKNTDFNAPRYFLPLKQTHMGDVEMVVAVFGGVTALVTACFAGAKFSRCTLIKTPCLELHRDVPPQIAQV